MLTFNAITHTCNMVGNLKKTCYVCYKSMRGDNLKKHMKKHERGISCTDEELENEVININKEFNRKIELGWKLNKIMNEYRYNENGLDNDMKEALKTYKLHVETKEDMYKCKLCAFGSKRKFDVNRHEKAMHYYHD